MFWYIFGIVSCVKLLLIPAYHSTDFEVHRNWLAITYNLPIHKWYRESTSEWTLDYPPLFAWFEYFLSHVAKYFDPGMLKIENLNYATQKTVLFQRLSVIASDLAFAYGIKECTSYLSSSGVRKSSKWASKWCSPVTILQILLFGNVGLIMVDHIHFQYNGFLYGIFLLSICKTLEKKYVLSAIYFAALLNLKHIFLYVSPAYFVYMLRNYCFSNLNPGLSVRLSSFSKNNFLKLSSAVLLVFLASFGPFALTNQLPQILDRLFPFKRGLSHAYWAPNFWALYNGFDKILETGLKSFRYETKGNGTGTLTRGLVGNSDHVVMPSISPRTTVFLTGISMLPCLIKLWRCPGNPLHFVRCLVICGLSAFLFGWHVHEKAILMSIIPLSLTAVIWQKEAQIFTILSVCGHYSLHPLLFNNFEVPLKFLLFCLHCLYSFSNLSFLFDEKRKKTKLPLLNVLESAYVLGFVFLFLAEVVLFPLCNIPKKWPFLVLLLTSCYCALGVLYCWVKYYWHFVAMNEFNHKRKTH